MKRPGSQILAVLSLAGFFFAALLTAPAEATSGTGGAQAGAAATAVNQSNVNAIRGYQSIRTNPPCVRKGDGSFAAVTVAHPMQLIFPDVDGHAVFLAIGTYKCDHVDGSNGTSCASDFGNQWNVYTDGFTPGGIYFCNTEETNTVQVGDKPYAKEVYGTCNNGATGFQQIFRGVQENCKSAFGAPVGGAVGMEISCDLASVCNNQLVNADAVYTSVDFYSTLFNTYYDFPANARTGVTDPAYHVDGPSGGRVATYYQNLD